MVRDTPLQPFVHATCNHNLKGTAAIAYVSGYRVEQENVLRQTVKKWSSAVYVPLSW